LATATGGALAAAMLSMGTAHADPTVVVDSFSPPDPYAVLFGAAGGDTVGTQGYEDNALDTSLLESAGSGQYDSFYTDVSTFESLAGDHGLENLIYAIDPSAFDLQSSADIIGTATSTGDYLVPESTLGYLATGLDYGLLTPTGLDYVLTPLIDILLGQG
jgi:hypothetical protein